MRTIWLILCLLGVAVAAHAQDQKVTADLISNTTAVESGKPFTLAVRLRIQPGWHVYWQNPGDSGAPPKVKWTLPDGATAGALHFPIPRRLDVGGGLISFGYEDELVLLTTITPGKVAGDHFSVSARVSWVVCQTECKAGHQTVSLDLPIGNAEAANEKEFSEWQSQQPVRGSALMGRHASVSIDAHDANRGEISFSLNEGEQPIDFFPPATDSIVFEKPALRSVDGQSVETIPFKLLSGPHDDFTGGGAGGH